MKEHYIRNQVKIPFAKEPIFSADPVYAKDMKAAFTAFTTDIKHNEISREIGYLKEESIALIRTRDYWYIERIFPEGVFDEKLYGEIPPTIDTRFNLEMTERLDCILRSEIAERIELAITGGTWKKDESNLIIIIEDENMRVYRGHLIEQSKRHLNIVEDGDLIRAICFEYGIQYDIPFIVRRIKSK